MRTPDVMALTLKLKYTNLRDEVLIGLSYAMEDQADDAGRPDVMWTSLTLGLSNNHLTENGMTRLVETIGRCCPRLKQLHLNLSHNDIRVPVVTDFIHRAVGHISGLSVKMNLHSRTDRGTFGDRPDHGPHRVVVPWRHEAVTTEQYRLSLHHYGMPPDAVALLPHHVVKLQLDLSGGRLMGRGGMRRMAEQLRGASHTLECLELYLSCMGLCDGEFVDLCSMGLASLHALRHVNLDVSHNVPLTTAGVNAIQTALRPSVRCLEPGLGTCFSMEIRREISATLENLPNPVWNYRWKAINTYHTLNSIVPPACGP